MSQGCRTKSFFPKLAIHHRKLCRNFFWNFLCLSQIFAYIAIFTNNSTSNFRIEYNAFSKAKFGNFQKLLKLNNYLQTIITGEKNTIWIESNVIQKSLASAGPFGWEHGSDPQFYNSMLCTCNLVVQLLARLFNFYVVLSWFPNLNSYHQNLYVPGNLNNTGVT